MKIFVSILFTLAAYQAFSAQPCNGNLEAQFIAQYNHVNLTYAEAGTDDHTTFDLKNFRYYQVNQTCPLDQDQAMNAVITENRLLTQIHGGVDVSGVLLYDPRTNTYFINY